MGIDSFRDLGLNQTARLIRPSEFAGQRIAIDVGNVGHIQMSIATKDQAHKTQFRTQKLDRVAVEKKWLLGILNFLEIYFLNHGILPLMVFDGPPRPEKIKELQKRAASKTNPRKEFDELEAQIEAFAEAPEDLPTAVISRYKQLVINLAWPSKENYENLDLILTQLGIPVMHAAHDAEELCAMLVRDGHAVASYSTDTDSLAFGTKLWLKSVDRQGFVGISKQEALNHLGVDFKTFLEVCITAGNDFFKIKGISMKTAVKLIITEGRQTSLNLPEKYSFDPDDYEATKRIFSLKSCQALCSELSLEPQLNLVASDETRDLLLLFGIPLQRAAKIFENLSLYLNKKRDNGEPEDPWDYI